MGHKQLKLVYVLVVVALSACLGVHSSPNEPGGTQGGEPPGSQEPNQAASPNAVEDPNAPSTGPLTRLIGRFDTSNASLPVFSWSGSAITTRSFGTSVAANLLELDTSTYGGKPVDNYFDVYIDGALTSALKLAHNANNYMLAQNLAEGNHTVRIVKRTEAQVGRVGFGGFTAPGGTLLPAPLSPNRKIEFIGDSITCGYGAMANVTSTNMCVFGGGTNLNANWTFDNSENIDLSYVTLTAEHFGADATIISFSGKGVVQNIDTVNDKVNTLPVLYPYTNPDNSNILWNFSEWQPDVVVVNAGTNDYYNYSNNPTKVAPPNAATFTAGYLAFLKTLRKNYPNAHIVCALGPMLFYQPANQLATTNIQSAISQAQAAGDMKISFVAFTTLTGPYYACDYHPNATEHQGMATTLEAAITKAVGW